MGPAKGWVTTNVRGKNLLMREELVPAQATPAKAENEEASEQASEVSTSDVNCQQADEKEPSQEEKEALRQYAEKFGEARDGRQEGYNRKAFPWFSGQPQEQKQVSTEALQAALAYKEKKQGGQKRKPKLWDIDSDGEDVPICPQCYLPVGEFAYRSRDSWNACVHAECMASVVAQEAQLEEEQRVQKETAKKLKSRQEYDIGWKHNSVPKNSAIAERLGCSPLPQGLCCLVYDEVARTVRIAATHEPSAAVNLEYLLLALKVRKDKCREPLFSLDPVDVKNMEKTPQAKRYEPEWLAGTSVGDVMFQADYFLKELALGEYDMPIVGMLSIFDWSEMQEDGKAEWAAREWFVVKKAEVRMAQDKTLVPHVKMGVEAREQVVTSNGLEDKAVTGSNHPCKKFADAFTRNFDLIAERKSVIYHLRELAKASVMAKFLVDSNARVEKSWYALADEIIQSTKPEAHPEIPQLWNMRGNSRIQLKDGKLMNIASGLESKVRAIYGGVQFGLDKFDLAQRSALQGTPLMAPQLQGMQMGSRQPMFMPQRFQLGQRGETPQGVDLNLDKFSLTAPDRMNNKLPPCSASLDSLEGRTTLGRAFLQTLQQGSHPSLKKEHFQLLKSMFNPAMCDRAAEGAAFVPPDPDLEYVGKVRNLVNEESAVLTRRKTRFFDKKFVAENPGPEFPISWTARCQIENEGRTIASFSAADQHALVQVEANADFHEVLINDVLPTAAPDFSKSTEEGVTFRIYRIGSLEIRTTQEQTDKEIVGVVFSRRAPSWQLETGKHAKEVRDGERIVKAKVYIEAASDGQASANPTKPAAHFYVVLETDAANVIVTEKLANNHSVSWAVNPQKLEDRNSLARLLFTIDHCKDSVVQAVRGLQDKHSVPMPASAAPATSKAYAKAIFQLITGRGFRGKWGGSARYYGGRVSLATSTSQPTEKKSSTYLAGIYTARKKATTDGPGFSRTKLDIF
eukprot:TRINITY_DN4638_c0_g3_i1.p1 TRINITY_DN4638_c0_g3~~TRINITY_DN4638_c0_g3_i1.p1  ORF type:complete len:1047 (-),score=228.89 TRINITY_DN4638_c0_g3_i1:30-2930(-)